MRSGWEGTSQVRAEGRNPRGVLRRLLARSWQWHYLWMVFVFSHWVSPILPSLVPASGAGSGRRFLTEQKEVPVRLSVGCWYHLQPESSADLHEAGWGWAPAVHLGSSLRAAVFNHDAFCSDFNVCRHSLGGQGDSPGYPGGGLRAPLDAAAAHPASSL